VSGGHGAGIQRNTLILMAGSVVQAAIALLTVPAYLSTVGEERFGAYVVAFLLVVYFGLFERGLGAAVQVEISQLGPEAAEARSVAVWTAVVLNALLGLLIGAALLAVGWILFANILSLPPDLRAESLDALPVFAACVAVQMVLAVFQGSLIARERFGTVSVLDTLRMSGLQVLPLGFAYWWGPELVWLALGCLAALALSTVLFVAGSLGLALAPKLWSSPSRALAVRFFHYGKWVNLTGAISGLLEISDRLVLGALRGPTAVTTFAIPQNIASRLLIVPFSLIRVAFPRFSAIGADDSRALAASALTGLAAVTAPLAVLGATLAAPFLDWWIGGELATNAAAVAAVLFLGFWISGLGYVPHALLWAQSRPELPARLHAFELIPFLLILAVGVEIGGAFGAAVAWSCRAIFDSAVLVILARLPSLHDWRLLATGAIVTAAAVNGVATTRDTHALVAVGVVLVMLSLVSAWFLGPSDYRARISRLIRRGRAWDHRRSASDVADRYG
jgi:O-antigen/teichoic acid export membrane protein